MSKKLRVFEAFSGLGSQRMALKNLSINHEVVGIAEIDKFALSSYKAIHGDCPNFGDISKINTGNLPDIDLFTYSFPCQDLSVAGKQAGLGIGTRSGLLYECEKIIEGKKPKYLLLENVKNLVGKKFKQNFDKWLRYLESLGYTNYYDVLNAKDYGIPQNRERVFVVSILDDDKGYMFPEAIKLDKSIKDILEEEVDEKYYIDETIDLNEAYRIIDEIQTENQKPKILIKQATKKGYIEMEVGGVCDLTYPNSKTRRGRVQHGGKVCPTLTATSQNLVNIDEQYRFRKLTPLEYWRLMGFKDEDFYKSKNAGITNRQLYKQAGNSIVVKVLEGIFENLLFDYKY